MAFECGRSFAVQADYQGTSHDGRTLPISFGKRPRFVWGTRDCDLFICIVPRSILNSEHSLQQEWRKQLRAWRLYTPPQSIAGIRAEPVSSISRHLSFPVCARPSFPVSSVDDTHASCPLSCSFDSDVLVLCRPPSGIVVGHSIPDTQGIASRSQPHITTTRAGHYSFGLTVTQDPLRRQKRLPVVIPLSQT